MEQVFPVEVGTLLLSQNFFSGKGFSPTAGFKTAIIERILQPGHYVAALGEGLKVEVHGPDSLKVGNRVRVLFQGYPLKAAGAGLRSQEPGPLPEGTLQWSAFIPLAFGGRKAAGRLEVLVDRQGKASAGNGAPAVYFIFTSSTESLGELQWSIHLKGRQVALQVYAGGRMGKPSRDLGELIQTVEAALRKEGFLFSGPTVLLSKPFKVPTGFKRNWQG